MTLIIKQYPKLKVNWIYFVLAETIGFTALNPRYLHPQQWGGPFYVLGLTNSSLLHSVSNLQRGNFVIREESQRDEDEYRFEPPPIELYTQFSLLTYLLVFLGLLFLQSLTIFLVDAKLNTYMLQESNIWDRILHAIQKMHFPFPYVKWYKGDGNCMDHLKRKKETDIEVLSTIFVNVLFNMGMLTPLRILCKISHSNCKQVIMFEICNGPLNIVKSLK